MQVEVVYAHSDGTIGNDVFVCTSASTQVYHNSHGARGRVTLTGGSDSKGPVECALYGSVSRILTRPDAG